MKTCNFCGNKNFKENNVQYMYRHDGLFLIINDVPCEECAFCGEQYFKATVLKKIEKDYRAIYQSGKKAEKIINIPVEEFNSI